MLSMLLVLIVAKAFSTVCAGPRAESGSALPSFGFDPDGGRTEPVYPYR